MWRYNKGEWSEIYTFAYLLSSGILYAADKDLNKVEEVFFPIIRIIREETTGESIDYYTGDTIRIYKGEQLLKEINKTEFESIVSILLNKISKGSRAFEIPEAEDFFESVYCNKVKANSTKKEDITVQLHDVQTGIKPVCGFSIKSYLGAKPTLINPGTNTNFEFIINGCNDEIMNEVNAIDTRKKLIDKMTALLNYGCSFELVPHSISAQFEENLQFIDTLMPLFVQYMVLYSYMYNVKTTHDILEKMVEHNPLGFSNREMYSYKYKKLLSAWALGLTPERTDWLGTEDANGGYITVKNDGSVVCYHLYNRTEFEQYLFDYSVFDRPSTSKYHYFDIYKEEGQYKVKFCLQVRFK